MVNRYRSIELLDKAIENKEKLIRKKERAQARVNSAVEKMKPSQEFQNKVNELNKKIDELDARIKKTEEYNKEKAIKRMAKEDLISSQMMKKEKIEKVKEQEKKEKEEKKQGIKEKKNTSASIAKSLKAIGQKLKRGQGRQAESPEIKSLRGKIAATGNKLKNAGTEEEKNKILEERKNLNDKIEKLKDDEKQKTEQPKTTEAMREMAQESQQDLLNISMQERYNKLRVEYEISKSKKDKTKQERDKENELFYEIDFLKEKNKNLREPTEQEKNKIKEEMKQETKEETKKETKKEEFSQKEIDDEIMRIQIKVNKNIKNIGKIENAIKQGYDTLSKSNDEKYNKEIEKKIIDLENAKIDLVKKLKEKYKLSDNEIKNIEQKYNIQKEKLGKAEETKKEETKKAETKKEEKKKDPFSKFGTSVEKGAIKRIDPFERKYESEEFETPFGPKFEEMTPLEKSMWQTKEPEKPPPRKTTKQRLKRLVNHDYIDERNINLTINNAHNLTPQQIEQLQEDKQNEEFLNRQLEEINILYPDIYETKNLNFGQENIRQSGREISEDLAFGLGFVEDSSRKIEIHEKNLIDDIKRLSIKRNEAIKEGKIDENKYYTIEDYNEMFNYTDEDKQQKRERQLNLISDFMRENNISSSSIEAQRINNLGDRAIRNLAENIGIGEDSYNKYQQITDIYKMSKELGLTGLILDRPEIKETYIGRALRQLDEEAFEEGGDLTNITTKFGNILEAMAVPVKMMSGISDLTDVNRLYQGYKAGKSIAKGVGKVIRGKPKEDPKKDPAETEDDNNIIEELKKIRQNTSKPNKGLLYPEQKIITPYHFPRPDQNYNADRLITNSITQYLNDVNIYGGDYTSDFPNDI